MLSRWAFGEGSSCREISAWAIAEVKERSQRLKGTTSASVGLENKVQTGVASGQKPACQCRRCKILRFDPWIRKIPWRRA